MAKRKSKLSDYLKMFAIGLIDNANLANKAEIINHIQNMPGKNIIGSLPSGILQYLKYIDD